MTTTSSLTAAFLDDERYGDVDALFDEAWPVFTGRIAAAAQLNMLMLEAALIGFTEPHPVSSAPDPLAEDSGPVEIPSCLAGLIVGAA